MGIEHVLVFNWFLPNILELLDCLFFFNFSLPLQSLSAHLLDLELDIDPFHAIVTFKISFLRCLLLLLGMEVFFFYTDFLHGNYF